MRWFVEESLVWWLGGKGQSGEGVHDHVNPEHLDSSKDSLLGLESRDEHNDDSDYVDGQLELEELSDGVINISSPHDSSDDGGEVIVQKDDISSLSGDLSTGVTHSESDIGSLESWGVIGSVTSDSNHVSVSNKSENHSVFIFWSASGHDVKFFIDLFERLKVSNFVNFDLVPLTLVVIRIQLLAVLIGLSHRD